MTSNIRQTVIAALTAKLAAIMKPGYNFDVGASRVFDYLTISETVATPAVILYEGQETVDNRVGDRNARELTLIVVFVDSYSGSEPTKRARDFLSDVQRALGSEFVVNVPLYQGGTGNTTVILKERSNILNAGEPIRGRIWGQIEYSAEYRTHYLDPSKH